MASGEADLTMAGATQSMPYVTQDQMRGIAVSGPHRLPSLPDLQTFAELGAELRTDGARALREQSRADTASLGRVIRGHDIRLDQ